MESNTYSSPGPGPGGGGRSGRLVALAADVDELATKDLHTLTDAALVEEALELRRLVDGLEGQWLRRLAAIDARGAAGADQGVQVGSTAAWLRNRLHLGAGAAACSSRIGRQAAAGPAAGLIHRARRVHGARAPPTHRLSHLHRTDPPNPPPRDARRRRTRSPRPPPAPQQQTLERIRIRLGVREQG